MFDSIDPYDLETMEKAFQQSLHKLMQDEMGLSTNGVAFVEDSLKGKTEEEPVAMIQADNVSCSALVDSWFVTEKDFAMEPQQNTFLPEPILLEEGESLDSFGQPPLSYFWRESKRQCQLMDALYIKIDNN